LARARPPPHDTGKRLRQTPKSRRHRVRLDHGCRAADVAASIWLGVGRESEVPDIGGEFVPDLSILVWIYGAAVLAAAPIGPVNTVAIRRGLIGRWTHAMWVGIGSVLVEAVDVAIALWGSQELAEKIPVQAIRHWLGLPGAGIILLLGLHILRKSLLPQRLLMAGIRLEQKRRSRTSFLRDMVTGGVLTAINPLTLLYWVAVVAPQWVQRVNSAGGGGGVLYGIAAAVAGLSTWFGFLTVLVMLRPQRVGPAFFRVVNAACGVALAGMGVALAIKALL
jgi:L-lysine exporter family protein LysE/ArgO